MTHHGQNLREPANGGGSCNGNLVRRYPSYRRQCGNRHKNRCAASGSNPNMSISWSGLGHQWNACFTPTTVCGNNHSHLSGWRYRSPALPMTGFYYGSMPSGNRRLSQTLGRPNKNACGSRVRYTTHRWPGKKSRKTSAYFEHNSE